ncbi:hypothetical protein San01_12720 [Streptomyces angustmyceticus]|uniref:HTH cro/C1-type domain-containing protein n=3 Tax=Streptomyces angustmyceticus TaxID=285578 RepID=A0A5J4LF46_9ACTN|nr:hypothetical protein San01_12720 [Streptomyces angustmyceticus]
MFLLEQPGFGARLREIRQARGMLQSELTGPGMSPAYLSRLESGNRPPTERALAYLSDKLGVPAEIFRRDDPDEAAQQLAVALSSSATEDIDIVPLLLRSLERPGAMDPALRWQALWILAETYSAQEDRDQEQSVLRDLVALGTAIGNPRLEVRGRTRLARCLRDGGRLREALGAARDAHALAVAAAMPPPDTARALLALVLLEADTGRHNEAASHTEELLALTAALPLRLGAEALCTASTVRVRQKRHAEAVRLLEQALERLDPGAGPHSGDILPWLRLRLAAAWLFLQMPPRGPAEAGRRLREAAPVVDLLGNAACRREFLLLRSYLAFHQGDHTTARELCDRVGEDGGRLAFRDRIRLRALRSQLALFHEHGERSVELTGLARQAERAGDVRLTAEDRRSAVLPTR